MTPPPVTPSPRRFVIKKQKVGETPLAQAHHRPTSQFNATPRFHFSSTPRPILTQQELSQVTPSAARFSTPAHKTLIERDAIEESSDDVPLGVDEEEDIDIPYDSENDEEEHPVEEPLSKRRRLSSSPEPDLNDGKEEELKPSVEEGGDLLTSSLPILSSPPAPKRVVSTTAPRFLRATTATPITYQSPSTQDTFLKPPRFRPPDPSEGPQTQLDPLPDQFSPHRKGQKYIAGGLAAEVRDWLINLESAIPSAARKSKDDIWPLKLRVDEVSGGSRTGMTLVRGRLIDDGGMLDTVGTLKVILAGEGATTGLQKGAAVFSGRVVGIKAPGWEVVIAGVKWGVAVDWKVLS